MPASVRSRGALAAALVVLGLAAFAAPGHGRLPITITSEAKVSPNTAGTKAKPRGVKLTVDAHIEMPDDFEPPLVRSVDVWFPAGGLYNGAKHPRCSQAVLSRRGLKGCPRGSIMGKGRGNALADTVITRPRITVVNGGPRKVFFYTVMTNPAYVQAPVPGTITKLGGKWSYKLHAVIPRSLQIVAGIPIYLQGLHIAAGRGDWLATTACPASKRWAYHVEANFANGQTVEHDGSTPCR